MADGLRSRARALFDMSGKRQHSAHSSPSKSVSNTCSAANDGSSEAGSLDSSSIGSSKRPRESAPLAGVQPLSFTDALLAQEVRMQKYLEIQFRALGEQLRELTLRQADHEQRITCLETLDQRVSALETASAASNGKANENPASLTTVSNLQAEIDAFREDLENKTYKLNNIIITGLPEDDDPPSSSSEGKEAEVRKVKVPPALARKLQVTDDDMEECRLLGQRKRSSQNTESRPRPLLVRLRTLPKKRAVMQQKKSLRTCTEFSKVFINDDLTCKKKKVTKKEQERRRSLVPMYKKLRAAKVPCSLRRDQLFHEGNSISTREAEVLLSLISVDPLPPGDQQPRAPVNVATREWALELEPTSLPKLGVSSEEVDKTR